MVKAKFIIGLLLAFLWLPLVNATEPDYGLLGQGKADDLKKQLYEYVQESSGETRLIALNDLLDICILTEDAQGLTYAFDAHWRELVEQYETLGKGDAKDQERSAALFDSFNTKLAYRAISAEDEVNLKAILRQFNSPPFAPNFPHAGHNVALGARAAAMVGDRELAKKLQRRARGLIFQRNLNLISTQAALADLLETSLYQLHDVEDIRRFVRAADLATTQNTQGSKYWSNPYAYVRILRTAYDSGVLSAGQEIIAIELLHSYYQKLQITDGSTLDNKRIAFYGYLALEDALGAKRKLSFHPAEYLYQKDDQVFVGVGVRAYLEAAGLAPKGRKIGTGLSTLLAWFESRESQVGESVKRTNLPTYLILKSLDSRLKNDRKGEVVILEQFATAQMNFFRDAGYSMLDQPPALSRPALIVNEYALRRLQEIKPTSTVLSDFFLFNVLSINAAKDSNRQISYSLILEAANDLEREQVINFVVLNDRYNKTTSEVYTDAFIRMEKSRGEHTLEGTSAVQKFQTLEELFNIKADQLQRLRERPNNLTSWDTEEFEKLGSQATQVVMAESGDSLYLMLASKEKRPLMRILKKPSEGAEADALKILSSKSLAQFDTGDIKNASLVFSKFLFGDEQQLTGDIQFISGPLLLDVPYTLLSDPLTGKWIMQNATPRAFDSFAHAQISAQRIDPVKALRYVAFANPSLRTAADQEKLAKVESIIRGGRVEDLAELPETEIEVQEFSSLFDISKTKLYLREEANIDNFLSIDYSDVETLSLNTHGVVAGEIEDAKSPSIILSPTKLSSGVISSEWLFSARGAPRVAILSTCNSATSIQNFDHSEQSSLASAFLLKGSEAVISSYWQVNSLGATALMKGLAKRVAVGAEYGEALADATRDLIDPDSGYSHPSIWAAFVIIGRYLVQPEFEHPKAPEYLTASINGPVLAEASKNNRNVFSFFDVEGNRGQLLELSAGHARPIKPVFETLDDEFLRLSQNTENGVFFAVQKKHATDYYEYLGSASTEKICELSNPSNFLLASFYVDRSIIFSLYSHRGKEGALTVLITSQELGTCKTHTLGPYRFDKEHFPAVSVFSNLYPGPKENTALLIFKVPKVDKAGKPLTYEARDRQFGYKMNCEVRNGIEAYLISPSATILETRISGGMTFLDSPEARKLGLLAVEDGLCLFSNTARLVTLDWFVGDDPLINNYLIDKPQPSALDWAEKSIRREFSVVSQWWAKEGGDLIYVRGTPGIQSALFSHFKNGQLSPSTNDFLISSDYAIYAYSKKARTWRKLISQENCYISKPLSYSGKPRLACLKPSARTRYSETLIYEFN